MKQLYCKADCKVNVYSQSIRSNTYKPACASCGYFSGSSSRSFQQPKTAATKYHRHALRQLNLRRYMLALLKYRNTIDLHQAGESAYMRFVALQPTTL